MFQVFRNFLVFADKEKATWYKGVIFAIVHSIFEALQLFAIVITLRAIVENSMSVTTVWTTLGIMLVSVIGSIIARYISHTNEGKASYRMCSDKRINIGDRMKYMPMGYFNSRSLGNITATATTTMGEIEGMAPLVMVRTVHGFIHSIIFTIAVVLFDWRIGIISACGVLLFMLVNNLMLQKSRRLSPKRQAAQAKLVDAVLEYVQGMSVVKTFNLWRNSNKTLNKTILETEKYNFGMEIGCIPYIALQQLILRLTSVLFVACSIWFYISGSMPLFDCLLMMVCGYIVYSQLEAAGSVSFMILTVDASIDRVEDINRTPVMDIDGKDIRPHHFDIVFDKVSFSYENRIVIDNVSFTIPERTTTAIVGPSGGGKTTLCNLIARFWDVSSGAITIGSKNVKEYKQDALLSNISMVFQNVYLFNDTIANNIKFGRPAATMEEVIYAAKQACCHDFIMALPDGYDTVIGEGGATISGGEKQRISIARAILKDAPIVILDDSVMM